MVGKRSGPAILILALAAAVFLVRRSRPGEGRRASEDRRRRPWWRWLLASSFVVALLGAAAVLFSAYASPPSTEIASALPTSESPALESLEAEVGRLRALLPAAPEMEEAAPAEAPPAGPPLSPGMARLAGDLEALVRSLEGPDRASADIAVAVLDLQSGEAIAVDGDEPHLAGCTIKFFPALKAVYDVREGRREFDDTLDYLLQRTVRISNNADSYYFIDLVGIPETNAFMTDIVGTSDSIITHAPGYFSENMEEDNYLTANDLVLAFAKLYRGELTTPELTSHLLDVMTQSWLTPAEYGVILYQAAPLEARVAHKIGYVGPPENAWNDAGLVMIDRPEGTVAYAVAILTQYNREYGEGPPVARQVAERVFGHFNETYRLGY